MDLIELDPLQPWQIQNMLGTFPCVASIIDFLMNGKKCIDNNRRLKLAALYSQTAELRESCSRTWFFVALAEMADEHENWRFFVKTSLFNHFIYP